MNTENKQILLTSINGLINLFNRSVTDENITLVRKTIKSNKSNVTVVEKIVKNIDVDTDEEDFDLFLKKEHYRIIASQNNRYSMKKVEFRNQYIEFLSIKNKRKSNITTYMFNRLLSKSKIDEKRSYTIITNDSGLISYGKNKILIVLFPIDLFKTSLQENIECCKQLNDKYGCISETTMYDRYILSNTKVEEAKVDIPILQKVEEAKVDIPILQKVEEVKVDIPILQKVEEVKVDIPILQKVEEVIIPEVIIPEVKVKKVRKVRKVRKVIIPVVKVEEVKVEEVKVEEVKVEEVKVEEVKVEEVKVEEVKVEEVKVEEVKVEEVIIPKLQILPIVVKKTTSVGKLDLKKLEDIIKRRKDKRVKQDCITRSYCDTGRELERDLQFETIAFNKLDRFLEPTQEQKTRIEELKKNISELNEQIAKNKHSEKESRTISASHTKNINIAQKRIYSLQEQKTN